MVEAMDKELLYRKLTRTRRLIAGPLDPVTVNRLKEYAAELERQLAVIKSHDADAPPDPTA
jgi:hypothetical protein